jgi:deoxyribonuclease-4
MKRAAGYGQQAQAMAPVKRDAWERLGAHVSTQGGVDTAPARGVAIGATAIQLFTKTPNQWKEPALSDDRVREFRANLESSALRMVVSHDSYLINLASPDPTLSARSTTSFIAELTRCRTLGIPWVVSHPGNYIDDRERGLFRNAERYTQCLREVPGAVGLLIENTAGSGTALGQSFAELALLRESIAEDVRHRVGFCLDTCHLYSAGYDLVTRYDAVWKQWEQVVGWQHLGCMHLNDSKTPFDSRRDRHALIGEGTLGPEPFRRIMRDPRFRNLPKILETPKGDDEVTNDRRMLRRLRAYARGRTEGR